MKIFRRLLALLTVSALVLATAVTAPRGLSRTAPTLESLWVATASGLSDLQLASYWAPVWMQDTDSSHYKADYITNFNYDGNWRGIDNWNNLSAYAAYAYVYYAVVETTTHYFITYADFHPRDWSELCIASNCHENDMEGVLLVIKKGGSVYGTFQLMVTVAHSDFYSYKDYHSAPSNAVANDREDIDGDVQFFDRHHPYVYVEAKGHGVYGAERWEASNFPGRDGVVYHYTGVPEFPASGNDRFVGYALLSMNALWERRFDYTHTYASYGTFRGNDYEDNAANAPWGWDDQDDGAVYRGDFYMRPAHLVEYYHNGLGSFSQAYIYSSDGAAR
jgi:hypothetical protein